jgi:hypothetical protein
MAYAIKAGISVSVDNITWFPLTDHNRQPIKITFEVIEKTNRMADGTLRRYVVARKHKIATSWQMVPSITSNTVDLNKAGAWMRSFYEANVFNPIYVRVVASNEGNSAADVNGNVLPDEDTYVNSFYASSRKTISGTSGSSTITVNNNTGLLKGMSVTGTGIRAGVKITNISSNTITLSGTNTATVSGIGTFTSNTMDYVTYITNFDYEVVKRNNFYDLVNINIDFTEV